MKTSRRRRITALIALPAAGALLLAGCGSGSGGGAGGGEAGAPDLSEVTDDQLEGTTIQLARVFGDCDDATEGVTDPAEATTECEVITILTNLFNEENEFGIKVERLGGTEWNTYYDALNAAFAGGEPPDVALMHGSSLPEYASRNLLIPLDDLVEITGADISDASPSAAEASSYEGETYSLPFDLHALLAHINVDLFTEAGLVDASGAPTIPTSGAELLEQAATMKETTGADYWGMARVNDNMAARILQSLMAQQGVRLLNDDNTEGQLDTPEAREALELLDSIYSEGYGDPDATYDAAQEAFLSGDVAMAVNGTWVVDQYSKEAPFTYQTTNFPTLFEEPAVWADSHTWAIPRQKEADPVAYRAALEFISFLYEHEADWAIGTGHLAARSSVLESPELQEAPQRANYEATGQENSFLVPHIPNWPAVDQHFIEAAESIWFEDADVDETLSSANEQINSELQ